MARVPDHLSLCKHPSVLLQGAAWHRQSAWLLPMPANEQAIGPPLTPLRDKFEGEISVALTIVTTRKIRHRIVVRLLGLMAFRK